jgi:hypothetical protein
VGGGDKDRFEKEREIEWAGAAKGGPDIGRLRSRGQGRRERVSGGEGKGLVQAAPCWRGGESDVGP